MGSIYEVGGKAMVIGEICGHQFEIGEIVTIIKDSGHHEHFQASNGKEEWYVSTKELFPYEVAKWRILEERQNEMNRNYANYDQFDPRNGIQK